MSKWLFVIGLLFMLPVVAFAEPPHPAIEGKPIYAAHVTSGFIQLQMAGRVQRSFYLMGHWQRNGTPN